MDKGIEEEGSNLSGVSGRCWWEDSSSLYDDGKKNTKRTEFTGQEDIEGAVLAVLTVKLSQTYRQQVNI